MSRTEAQAGGAPSVVAPGRPGEPARTLSAEEAATAAGDDFDRLFLKLVITHHQGAITMATEVLAEGNNVRIEEMAGDVIAQQTVEISRMRTMSP